MGNAPRADGSTGKPVPLDPVQPEPANIEEDALEEGIALCLSGGGYRAMLFHAGVLVRLNEIGYLPRLRRISSVSGGSITAALLGLRWRDLEFDRGGVAGDFVRKIVTPIYNFAGHTIDRFAILSGLATPFVSISDQVAKAYEHHLFGKATLQDLPDDKHGAAPRFVINATNVQTGALWRFSRPYMGDYRVGLTKAPAISLAAAVAASSAFPPILSPAQIDLSQCAFEPDPKADLQKSPYTDKAVLSDGGVYDNLGLETAWKRCRTLLVSDGGGKMQPEPAPHIDWARHALRVNDIIDNQVRSLRKRQLIAALEAKSPRTGAYWGIRTDLSDYPRPGLLSCPHPSTLSLASTPTRLKALDPSHRHRLMNWGYAVCAAAIESYLDSAPPPARAFPFPDNV